MIKINLVGEGRRPAAAKAKKSRGLPSVSLGGGGENAALIWLASVAAIGLLIVAGWWFLLNREIKDNDARIAEAQKRVNELQEILDQVEAFKRKEAELELKIEVITDLKNNQQGPVRIMERLSKAIPELLWVDQLSMQGNRVTLSGRAFGLAPIATFTENLSEVPEFFEPSLIDSQRSRQVYTFSLEFLFRPQAVTASGAVDQQGVEDDMGFEEEF